MHLFDLASKHMSWLSARQAVTAMNIANADTPGYRAQSIQPFAETLEKTATELSRTHVRHMGDAIAEGGGFQRTDGTSWGSAHGGNNVTLETELMTASSNVRMMNIDTSISRSFQKMILMSLKV